MRCGSRILGMGEVMLLTFWGVAHAALIYQTYEELCEQSSAVVVAEVTSIETRPGLRHDVETEVWFSVHEAVRGEMTDFSLVIAGGDLGEVKLWVEDTPKFSEDHTYLILLSRDEEGALQVQGKEGGVIELRTTGQRGGIPKAHALKKLGRCRA